MKHIPSFKSITFKLLACCLLFPMLLSCRKDEFQPEPEGVQVPHQDVKLTLQEALKSSAYTLFKAAWERSNMNSILKAKGNKAPFTLLVPTDAAFTAEGYSLQSINAMTPALLDSILLYHTVIGSIEPATLQTGTGNIAAITLLEHPDLRLAPYKNGVYDQYAYRQYIGISGKDLLINGRKKSGAEPVIAKDGVLWPIDQILHKPTKTMLQTLQDDGRFTLYLGILAKVDEQWAEDTFGSERTPYTEGLAIRYDYFKQYPNIFFTSIFAPTDEAFHQAGFNSVEDLMNLNRRVTLPHIDPDTWEMVGSGYVTDTLLTMHRWGGLLIPKNNIGQGNPNASIFYSNDLNNKLLADYALYTSGPGLPPYKVPLDFGKDASGHITIKAKQSPFPAASIIEEDINTLMGPIHVVNKLIPPKDFKY